MAMIQSDRTRRIRELNDQLRLAMGTSPAGRVVMTAGVAALPEEDVARVLERVRRFDEWTNDNDPHREHDFGSFNVGGTTYFFKVDYYSPDMEGGSEDPADPERRPASSRSCAPTNTDPRLGVFPFPRWCGAANLGVAEAGYAPTGLLGSESASAVTSRSVRRILILALAQPGIRRDRVGPVNRRDCPVADHYLAAYLGES